MKRIIFIFICVALFSCIHKNKIENTSQRISTDRGDVLTTKIKLEEHDYFIFRGTDYFSGVVHSASCNYCDSVKSLIKHYE